ncbi:MAG: alpha/beta hydrolase [Defluviitaleaceae bacterium]|nr:alpha/beta hydrolase [Defluviitaleaceae bacterium]
MRIEMIDLNKERHVTLTVYLQEVGGEFKHVAKRPAVLILPGGGYHFCSDREADPVSLQYLAAGYQAFVLRYSVNEHKAWPTPLEDYEAAMEMIRANADTWNLHADKVTVVGFSAGGHLAAAAATSSRNRPNAAILAYACLDDDIKVHSPSAPNTVEAIDEHTCPCFLFSTRDDTIVKISNTLNFMQQLDKHNVPFECHIYSHGPHGISTNCEDVQWVGNLACTRASHWVADSIGWLRDTLGEWRDWE